MTERRTAENGATLVFDMLQKQWLEFPKTLDVYVLGYPCTQWSMLLVIGCRCCVSAKLTSSAEAFVIMIKLRRGKGKGFQDSNAKPFWVGLETIKGALPKTFILECVEAMSCRRTTSEPESESSHDLEEATLQIIEKLGDQYHVMSLGYHSVSDGVLIGICFCAFIVS